MTLPSAVTVLLDDGTGSFPYDVSKYVVFGDGFSYNRGRADWQGGVTAGVLNLTLNNSDGRFTPGSTTIASPSPIRVDQRIRVKETVNGTTFTRFTGYVKSWPVQWPATVGTIAFSSITAVDAQARAERHIMGTTIAEEILADAPIGWWPMSDPVGSLTAQDASGNGHTMQTVGSGSPFTFGLVTPPGSETSPAVTFVAGPLGTNGIGLASPDAPGYGATPAFLVAFATTEATWSSYLLDHGGVSIDLSISNTGVVSYRAAISGGGFNDGAPHVAAVRYTAPGLADFYVDGVLIASGVITTAPTILPKVGINMRGTIAHVAAWSSAPSAARLISIGQAVLNNITELTSARISRLAYYADIPTGTLDTGLTTVPAQDTVGTSVWDAINAVTDTEMGTAFVDESGNVEFHNRNKVSLKTTPDLSLVAHQYIAPDFTPTDDDQSILNYVETTSSVTGVTQVVRNTTSELGNGTATNPGHGRYSDSKTYLVSTDAEALDRANWIVANFAEPTTRYGSLTVNLFAMPPAQAAAFLTALDLDMWLRVTSAPSQNTTGTTVDVVVEGFTETCKANEWYVTCNVVLRSLFNALILDNATYGVLDSSVARLGV